jgi:hypothetical protein
LFETTYANFQNEFITGLNIRKRCIGVVLVFKYLTENVLQSACVCLFIVVDACQLLEGQKASEDFFHTNIIMQIKEERCYYDEGVGPVVFIGPTMLPLPY